MPPSPRNVGIPLATEIPAPQNATQCFDCIIFSDALLIKLSNLKFAFIEIMQNLEIINSSD